MLVVRRILQVKQGCKGELIELLKVGPEYGIPRAPQGERVYQATGWYGGPWDVVIWEAAYEDVAEYQAWQKEHDAAPRLGETMEKALKLIERGSRSELWTVELLE